VDDEVTLDALTAGIEVYQRRRGHRFSSDDTVTAWVAVTTCPRPANVLDLGCGVGSVLLHLAWSIPDAILVGVEAQAVSFSLLERNVAHNGLGDRVSRFHGDLRESGVIESLGGPFDLVTGTPPYFPPTSASDAEDEQRAYARIEYRGGVEDYIATAARVLARDGWFVVCGDADADGRTAAAAAAQGLTIVARHVVIPRVGRPPLFSVWTMRRGEFGSPATEQVVTLRDAQGERTADAKALRAFSGFAEPS
jgi:tRNA1(Val) A37 N6-methylase TrmN6